LEDEHSGFLKYANRDREEKLDNLGAILYFIDSGEITMKNNKAAVVRPEKRSNF
jgi:hypothetical protein